MTFQTVAPLFMSLAILALLPSASVFAVVARSLSLGLIHGILTATGILMGDCIFVLLALRGLAAIADSMAVLFTIIKGVGASYLLWLGLCLWRTKPSGAALTTERSPGSLWSSFTCGLLITLSDPKAIIFYISFFPAFVDLSHLSVSETGVLLSTVAIAVGGAKMTYAYLAHKARGLIESAEAHQTLNRTAALVMVGTGVVLALNI